MNNSDLIYGFVFKGQLAEKALESTKCLKKSKFTSEEHESIIKNLGINDLDEEVVKLARKMAIIYAGISAFENTVRRFISDVLAENFGERWWDTQVSENIKKRAISRRSEEANVRWHTPRGDTIINYIDFGDLFLIIKNNWSTFEPFLNTQDWTENVLKTIERSRNVIMHSGELVGPDIERLGSMMRDWIKQVGA